MATFSYSATDPDGQPVSGLIDASNEGAAHELLRARGFGAIRLQTDLELDASMVVEPASDHATTSDVRLSAAEQAEFVQQVGDLVTAQLPLSIGLQALAEEAPSSTMRRMFRDMSADLDAGQKIEVVFARWSDQLPGYLTGMLRVSGSSRNLAAGLNQFVDHLRARDALRKQISMALAYPAVMLLIMAAQTVFLLGYIVPQFKSIFYGFGTELPEVTRLLIELSDVLAVLVSWWWLTLIGFGVGAWLGKSLLRRVLADPAVVRSTYSIPLLGPTVRSRALAEFSRLLAMLVRQDVRLPHALRLAGDGTTDANLREGAYLLSDEVLAGESLEHAAARLPHFGGQFVHALLVGRRDGLLGESLSIASEQFTGQALMRVRLLVMGLEPLLIWSTGVCVGFTVIALFMPLIKLMNDLS